MEMNEGVSDSFGSQLIFLNMLEILSGKINRNLQEVLDSRIFSFQSSLAFRHWTMTVFTFVVVRPGWPCRSEGLSMKFNLLFLLVVGAVLICPGRSTDIIGSVNCGSIGTNKILRLQPFEAHHVQTRPETSKFNLRLRGGSTPNSNFEEVGRAFVLHYYNIFDTNRAGLQSLYQEMSMMTFEGEKIQGSQAIAQKLTSLPFQSVKHEIITVDSQPSASGGVLVFVCGNLKVS